MVESPADVVAVEQSGSYRGRYFVLHGHLSPLDGIGPEQIGAREFEALLDSGEIREVILATNPTVEGEATAHFLGERAADRKIQASRIAHGVPIGGELEYVDGGTLAHALAGRHSVMHYFSRGRTFKRVTVDRQDRRLRDPGPRASTRSEYKRRSRR